MAEISNPKEFLEEALKAVDTLKDDKTAQAETQTRLKEAERALNTLRKTVEKEKSDTVKARRGDIESDYAKQLKSSESNISKIEGERSKARNKSVNERITESLAPAKKEIKELKEALSNSVKASGLPAFCRTKAFYTLFAAKSVKEILITVMVFAAVLVLLPLAVIQFIKASWLRITVFIVMDVLAVVIYILIYSATVAGKHDAVSRCRSIVDRIISDEKIIKQITGNIKNDKDDSAYNLGNYDAEIVKLTAVRDDIAQKRQQALSEFDCRTADTIRNEIDSRYSQKLTETQEAYRILSESLKGLNDKITSEEMDISRFTQYIGSRNLDHDNLQRMLDLVNAGEAESVSDAALKINSKGN